MSQNYEVPEGAKVVVTAPGLKREYKESGLWLNVAGDTLEVTKTTTDTATDDFPLGIFNTGWSVEVIVPEVKDAEGPDDEVVILHGGRTRSELIRNGMAPVVATYILRRNVAAEILKDIPHVMEKFRKILGDDISLMHVANLVSDGDSRAYLTELLSDTDAAGRDA